MVGYWVTIYLIFDGSHTYTLFSEADMIDNALMIMETGQVHTFSKDILVTPLQFPHIFEEINNYVSSPNFNKKC